MITDAEWGISQRKLDRLEERYLKQRERRQAKYNIPCTGSWSGTSLCCSEPPEFSCEYPNAPVDCGDCICNGGYYSPITGKRPYKRRTKDGTQNQV